jgi:hypothetical protein
MLGGAGVREIKKEKKKERERKNISPLPAAYLKAGHSGLRLIIGTTCTKKYRLYQPLL